MFMMPIRGRSSIGSRAVAAIGTASVTHQYAIIASQDAPRLLDCILLEFGQFNR